MIRVFTLIAIILLGLTGYAQDTSVLNKWKKAVVNLEMQTQDTTGYLQYQEKQKKYFRKLSGLRKEGKITKSQEIDSMVAYLEKWSQRRRIYSGSSIFVKKGARRYLVTARHVVHDSSRAAFRAKYKMAMEYDDNLLFNTIFIRSNFDREYADTIVDRPYPMTTMVMSVTMVPQNGKTLIRDSSLMKITKSSYHRLFGLTAFGSYADTDSAEYPYSFSTGEFDLAVLSLDNKHAVYGGPRTKGNLADYLESAGYAPIQFEDISEMPTSEGAEVFTVGFPGTARIGKINLNDYEKRYSSQSYSLPVFSFGRIAMMSRQLYRFWVDISVYPGNSGGPLVEKNKLVGIISGQAIVENNRIPFASVVKAKYIKDLLMIQEQKDLKAEEVQR